MHVLSKKISEFNLQMFKMFALLDDGMHVLICIYIFFCRDDCGVFVMAYAEHLVFERPTLLTQSDMWFYRQKIVHDIYYKQWENSGFLESTIDDRDR